MRGIHVDPAARRARAQGGRDVERVQPRHPRARPGHDRRRGLHHRRRRADARWRARVADGSVRHVHRQPGLRRGRARRRSGGHRQRGRGPGPVLGDPGRRRQLRCDHVVRVRRTSGRHRHRRHRGAPARRRGRGARHVPPVHQEPRRRLTAFCGLVHAPDGSGTKIVATPVCHCGDLDAGRVGPPAAPRVRATRCST